MGLQTYKSKRKLEQTPEPTGGKPTGASLQFVIQKHQASHLHYDFRLEIRGILKSWAVPKGPSLDPKVKRLAMLVEDHPFDYKDFEGVIPEGNYGAGTVIVWDQGTYAPAEKNGTKSDHEKILTKQFYNGKMHLTLHGKKIKGNFFLVRAPQRGETSWLLIKEKDDFARTTDITLKNKSVVSNKTIEQVQKDPAAKKWKSNRKAYSAIPKTTPSLSVRGKRAAMPKVVKPMLCTLTREPLNDDRYIYEMKWDGYRIISFVNGRTVKLHSRNGLNYTDKYPLIVGALMQIPHKMVLDGEVVVPDKQGYPDFNALQLYNGGQEVIWYYLFDIIWLDGYDLTELPLTERKEILKNLLGETEVLKFSESFNDGSALYQQMLERNLEGIVAKKKDSIYQEGVRNDDWLKTPTRKRQEFVVGGWAES
ncbi:MAG: DNA ligase, partial [Bacteroidetes bacterium]